MHLQHLAAALVLTLVFLVACIGKSELGGCPDCIEPALKITVLDSAGNKMVGCTMKFVDETKYETIVDDSDPYAWSDDSVYLLWGRGGGYAITVTREGYDAVVLESVTVTRNRCGINNPRCLTLKPGRKKAAKRQSAGTAVVADSVESGCGI